MKNLKFSCVVDNKSIFKAQAYILLSSLLKIGKIDPDDIYVHVLENFEDEFYRWLERSKFNIVRTEHFNTSSKYCNKLRQLETFTSNTIPDFDYVFLMDCDTALLSEITDDFSEKVYAKIVDFPLPPPDILKGIFKAANLEFTTVASTYALKQTQTTDRNNCNGGLYIISRDFLNLLAPKWSEYANWCIANSALFTPEFSKHADQVSFALAMRSLDTNVTPLGIEWNFPLHVGSTMLPDISPNLIHYHECIDEHMRVKPIGLKKVDKQISALNAVIANQLEHNLNNSIFWNTRYALYPELGSGVGSRGEVLDYKKKLIENCTFNFLDKSILDVGCGDLELMKDFNFKNYTGLDVSDESLQIGKSKRPDWNFSNTAITSDLTANADLIMCFDVLIHQSSAEDFNGTVNSICKKAGERVIVGAYNEPPAYSSHITYFYKGILDAIRTCNKFDEIGIMGTYRDVTVVVGSKNTNTHNRDIGSEKLSEAFSMVSRPDLLRYLVDIARHYLGFYTSHFPRVFEYTWLLAQLENSKDKMVLDIGAGVCPLPLALQEKGLKVTTIDSHPLVRDKIAIEEWNEWGFLDYAMFNSEIRSVHMDFSEFKDSNQYDCLYSISVIEHMPAMVRRKVLKKAASLLKKEGELLLTIDLIPNTDNLWNMSEDREVETVKLHGTIRSFRRELSAIGFQIVEEIFQRNIHNSRTDLYFVKAILKERSFITRWFKK